MSEAYTRGSTRGTIYRGNAANGAANVLSLAATPTFAGMAFLTSAFGGGPADVLCAASHRASPLSGMVLMYALMSAFHLAPWLALMSGRYGARRSDASSPNDSLTGCCPQPQALATAEKDALGTSGNSGASGWVPAEKRCAGRLCTRRLN